MQQVVRQEDHRGWRYLPKSNHQCPTKHKRVGKIRKISRKKHRVNQKIGE